MNYDQIYRKLNPKRFPYSPWERQVELSDLWPVDQQKFKDEIDLITKEIQNET